MVLTANHSFKSSPLGNSTARSMFPLPNLIRNHDYYWLFSFCEDCCYFSYLILLLIIVFTPPIFFQIFIMINNIGMGIGDLAQSPIPNIFNKLKFLIQFNCALYTKDQF